MEITEKITYIVQHRWHEGVWNSSPGINEFCDLCTAVRKCRSLERSERLSKRHLSYRVVKRITVTTINVKEEVIDEFSMC